MYASKLLMMNCERVVRYDWPEGARALINSYKESVPNHDKFFDDNLDSYLKFIKDNERRIIRDMIAAVTKHKDGTMAAALRPDRFFTGLFDLIIGTLKRIEKTI